MLQNPVDLPVIESVAGRYSAYLFDDKSVTTADLKKCLEAARWAASSFNDQPWTYIVARKEDTEAFQTMVGVLADANQGWAKHASVLMIGVTRTKFRYNGQDNRVALHDLGAASAHMSLQAASLGLQIHQMAGVDQEAAAKAYDVPEDHQVQTAIALGYPMTGEPSQDQQSMRDRERGSRERLTLGEQVFGGKWGRPASWLG